jgi:serine/threonine protein kinase
MYWAPELLGMEPYSIKADIWALGVSLYMIATGENPFNSLDEESFREDVMTSHVDYSRMATNTRLKMII